MLTAADARTNTSSANYKAGYNAGIASVTVSASASGRTVTATASNGKTASASVAYAGSNGVVSVSTSGGSGNQSFDITDGWCTKINVDRTGAYNKGVTDADARTNTSSANYKAGYNAGYEVGKKSASFNVSNVYHGRFMNPRTNSYWANGWGNMEQVRMDYTITVSGTTATLSSVKIYGHFNGHNNGEYWYGLNVDENKQGDRNA